MIAIVNYGLGNVGAFVNAYRRMGMEANVANCADDLEEATHVILPGVGAFDHAMALLDASGMREPLDALARRGDVPVLGVCVGMQILATRSQEGVANGLGWIKGNVLALRDNPGCAALPSPHMGWNNVNAVACPELFRGLTREARFYFLHSYYFSCEETYVGAYASYGIEFACTVRSGNIFGVQFHPEKSHHWGATLLRNFGEV